MWQISMVKNEPYSKQCPFSDGVEQVKVIPLFDDYLLCSSAEGAVHIQCCLPSAVWTVTMNLLVCVLFMVQDEQSSSEGRRVQGLLTCTQRPQASIINMSSLLMPIQPSISPPRNKSDSSVSTLIIL